jgi:hypothetical protein
VSHILRVAVPKGDDSAYCPACIWSSNLHSPPAQTREALTLSLLLPSLSPSPIYRTSSLPLALTSRGPPLTGSLA